MQQYIEHHGIPGQKWGKRNGPPYPLNDSRKSVSEKVSKRRTSFAKGVTLDTAESRRLRAAARVERNERRLSKKKADLESGKIKVEKYLKKENKLMRAIEKDNSKYERLSKEIQEAIKLSAKNGKKALRLETLKSNLPAQHMYDKAGFSYRGEQYLYAENTGWTDFLYYEKTIS